MTLCGRTRGMAAVCWKGSGSVCYYFFFAFSRAPLAQLDRASGYEPEGREFESLRARHS